VEKCTRFEMTWDYGKSGGARLRHAYLTWRRDIRVCRQEDETWLLRGGYEYMSTWSPRDIVRR
jgi:hypothetical protein